MLCPAGSSGGRGRVQPVEPAGAGRHARPLRRADHERGSWCFRAFATPSPSLRSGSRLVCWWSRNVWVTDRTVRRRRLSRHRFRRNFSRLTYHRLRRLRLQMWLRLRRARFEAETRRCATDHGVLDRRVDQRDLGHEISIWLVPGRRPLRRTCFLETVLFLAPRELGREPFRPNACGRPMCVRQQRAFHPLLFRVRFGRRSGVVESPCDEAIPLIAHEALIGIGRANLAPR
jgi:hypothetical protein